MPLHHFHQLVMTLPLLLSVGLTQRLNEHDLPELCWLPQNHSWNADTKVLSQQLEDEVFGEVQKLS